MVHITHHGNDDRGKSWNYYALLWNYYSHCVISHPSPCHPMYKSYSINFWLPNNAIFLFVPWPNCPLFLECLSKYILYFHPNSRLPFASSRQIYFEGVKEKKKRFMCFFLSTGVASYTCLHCMIHPSVQPLHITLWFFYAFLSLRPGHMPFVSVFQ